MLTDELLPVLVATVLMVIAFSITWAVQLRTQNAGIVDAAFPEIATLLQRVHVEQLL